MDISAFRNPGKEYRGVPFWSWNDDLRDEELIRQINEMDEKGWGAFFMHSRVGLVTPYLSNEWMARIKTCVEHAKKADMGAWLYDEDKWPSGYAGGIVPRKGPEYRQRALCLSEEKPTDTDIQILAVYLKDGKDPNQWKRISEKESEKYDRDLVYIYRWIQPLGDPWFQGTSYVDLLNPKVTDAFLESTYEAYKKAVGDQFGKAVPGIFTDEPTYLTQAPYPGIPWTEGLPARFRKERGYSILDHLLSLFYDIGDFKKIRYDFWRTATELFLESYSIRMYKWCDRNNLKYTGHYLAEDTLTSQIRCIGAAMPHYEYMHYPGIDHLNRNIDNLMTAKQVSSVAHQLGKPRVLSEMYGCSGQNFSFEGRKWIGDWHFVNGINIVNQHLSLYTMRGERKRDYPPNIFWQQPWWKHNRPVADYMARLSYALTQGERVVTILVIHPIESAWAVYNPQATEVSNALSEDFARLSENLLAMNYDFDYGDESIIARHGKVEGSKFCVGKSAYDVVIIPPSLTLRATTVHFLHKFVSGGGKLIAIKPFPMMIEGRKDERIWNILKHAIPVESDKVILKASLKNAVDEVLPEKDVDVKSRDGNDIGPIWHHHRRENTIDIYFLANMSLEEKFEAHVALASQGMVEEWNPLTGEKEEIPCEQKDGKTFVELTFEPVASHLITIDRSAKPSENLRVSKFRVVEEIPLGEEWEIKRKDPNALTLDYCQYKPEGGEWTEKLPTWKVYNLAKEKGGKFTLRYAFEVVTKPKGASFLVVETPEKFKISVNGHSLAYKDIGYWVDTTFKKIDITDVIRLGENRVELEAEMTKDLEIEYCYIIGDFALALKDLREFKIVEEKTRVTAGDFVTQGYPFFAGTVELLQKVRLERFKAKRVLLNFVGLETTVAEVEINGKVAGKIFWRPHQLEITDFVKEGENQIKIRLTNSLRNLLGPHHHRKGELLSVGPRSFSDEVNWTDIYHFVPFGFKRVSIQYEEAL